MCQRFLFFNELIFESQNLGVIRKKSILSRQNWKLFFKIFFLTAVNNKYVWGLPITYQSKIIHWYKDLVKKWKITKNYAYISTVTQVGKHLNFSIIIFSPVFWIYEISRKNPTLTFFAYFWYKSNCCNFVHPKLLFLGFWTYLTQNLCINEVNIL